MLKKLGLGKKSADESSHLSRAGSGEKVRRHQDLRQERDAWREEAGQMVGIVSKLSGEYSKHKSDFALGRYDSLKTMIKDAVQEYRTIVDENKSRKTEQYSGSGGQQREGSLIGLMKRAKDFADHKSDSGTGQKSYSEMSSKEVDEEISLFRREILQYKQDFREARDKLEKLSQQYETSKQLSPNLRYAEMKNMIKEITRAKLLETDGLTHRLASEPNKEH